MIEWYRVGTSEERRTFWACFMGWALDTFDVQVYFFILPILMASLHLTKADAGMIGTVSLLATAVGGWIAGILADRYGRVRVLIGTIIWFTAFGIVAGFSTAYEHLLVVRTLQGLGFGGEWAVGAALMAEVINPAHRGKAMGLVQSGYSFGFALASMVTAAIIAALPGELAWRVVFWFGVIPGIIAWIIARKVREPEIFRRVRQTVKREDLASFRSIFRRGVRRATILGSLFVSGCQWSSYALVAWMPTLLVETRKLPPQNVMAATMVVSVGAFCGFVTTAYICDRFGRRLCLIGFSAASFIFTAIYTLYPVDLWLIIVLGFPIGFTVNGMFAAIGPYLSELFPTEIRATCIGFCYNFGKSVGAWAVTLVGLVAAQITLPDSICLFSFGGYALAVVALWAMPETRGRRLDELSLSKVGSQETEESRATT
jgi:MFS family permease